jgi:hypothetical protein
MTTQPTRDNAFREWQYKMWPDSETYNIFRLKSGWDAGYSAALASQGDEIKALRDRYDILFELYADHIHDHRLGTGKACDGCKAMIDAQIDAALEPGCLDTKKASKFDPDGSEYEEESYQTGG